MTIDTFLTYALKKEAEEKCTYEVQLRLWRKIAFALGLPNTQKKLHQSIIIGQP